MKLEVSQHSLPLSKPFSITGHTFTHLNTVWVTLEEEGFVGRGEGTGSYYLGEDPTTISRQIEEVRSEIEAGITLEQVQSLLPRGGARNAVDCALWDLEAKRTGRRVWELAGLAAPGPEITAYTLSLDTPEKMQAQAALHAYRPLLKIKLGTPDDMPRLEAVRAGAPDAQIIIDANEGWSAEVYADLAPHLVWLGVSLVEQPLPAGEDDALIGMDRPVPVCADESCHDRSSLPKLKGKYDVVNIKLDKTGGLTEALALRDAALAEGYDVMVGCMVGSSLAMAPATLVAQGARVVDLDGPLLLAEDREDALIFDAAGVHPPTARLWG